MDSGGEYTFLEPAAVLFSEHVTSGELQSTKKYIYMFYTLNSPHPSAFLAFLVVAFPLEKPSVWMLLPRGAAGGVH